MCRRISPHTLTLINTHTRPQGLAQAPLIFISTAARGREPIFSQHFARTFVPSWTTFLRSGHTLLVPFVKEADNLAYTHTRRLPLLPALVFSLLSSVLGLLSPPQSAGGAGYKRGWKALRPGRWSPPVARPGRAWLGAGAGTRCLGKASRCESRRQA